MYLNCHTYFSLKYGTFNPEQLVLEAVDKGAEALVLTDINNTSAAFNFYRECVKHGIKPIVGIEFRNEEEDELAFIGIAKNNQGFFELNSHYSFHQHNKKKFALTAPEFKDCYIIYPFGRKLPEELRDYEYIGVKISDLNRLITSDVKKRQDKLVMLHPVTFRTKTQFLCHRLLRAMAKNTLISKLEAHQHAPISEVMLPMDKLLGAYGRFPKIIENTMRLIESCNIHFDSKSKNKLIYTGSIEGDKLLLAKLARIGVKERYGEKDKEAHARVAKELEIIYKLNFSSYFLFAWDVIRFTISSNFSYVGRGSGANSIVAYCLKITDVDPIELDLYFERFLNPYRQSPPDFDIDFSWRDRDEVIDYIFKRYGHANTALICTYSTMKARAIIRELGKVFGLPKSEIDLIVKYRKNKNSQNDKYVKWIYKYGRHIQNFPHHLSIHAGGIIISEEPIHNYTATDLPPKGFPITHFDMFVAEDMGFYKLDILSQRGLGHIKDAINLVRKNKGEIVEISTNKAKVDSFIRDHIKDANTIGCFYIESPAMRMLLKKLKCSDYKTLVAASSIIRPGVAQSGMMQQYISRFHDPDKVEYLHPKMAELLKETFGVMVYQEDVIKVAHHFAGLDLGEADVLRRAMSGKYKGYSGFQLVKDKYFKNCKELGHSDEIAQEVWRQMESFGGYSFSKAHSASFAVESYHSLYLKAHHPLEFITAVIKNWGGFYSREFYIQEARKNGAVVETPCVNHSQLATDLIGKTIYIGFEHIKGFERSIAEAICLERELNGSFKTLEDFIKRIPVGLEQLNNLIRVGGFKFTGEQKKVLLLNAALLSSEKKSKVYQPELFETETKALLLPVLDNFTFEDAYDELEILGFPVCFPFELLPADYKAEITAKDMMDHLGKVRTIIGYYVTVKDTVTKHDLHMGFGHFLDCNGDTFDTTHFPDSIKNYPFQEGGFYLLRGKVAMEFDYPSIEVHYMEKLPLSKKEVISESK
jgi:DNA-directed DNA polymerase III PolC